MPRPEPSTVIVPGSGAAVTGPTLPSKVNATVPMTSSKPLELLLSTGPRRDGFAAVLWFAI
jgi:hypothetical protein